MANLSDIDSSEENDRAKKRFPCIHRGEPLRTVRSKPCAGSRTGVVYSCTVHSECTVLSYLATARGKNGKSGKRLKVCLACKDRDGGDTLNSTPMSQSGKYDCKFFGEQNAIRQVEGREVLRYECLHPDVPLSTIPSECDMCHLRESLSGNNPPVKKIEQPTGHQPQPYKTPFTSFGGLPVNIGNTFQGVPCFVVGGGPSTKSLDLSRLEADGIMSMAINNAATLFTPTCFVHGDPPEKFHDRIWKNPNILKFTPKTMFKKATRFRGADGNLHEDCQVKEHPNVIGFARESTFSPEKFLDHTNISFGNSKKAAKRNGYPRVMSTLFSAIKLAYVLGSRKIFLVGVDFNMTEESPYAFNEGKRASACSSNNGSYKKIYKMLEMLVPHFNDRGLELYNCNMESGLDLFPYVSYEDALTHSVSGFPDNTNARGWYDKD